MDYKRLTIHPLGKNAGAEIGEIVHERSGTLIEHKLLGMLYYEADFENGKQAIEAMRILEKMECVSNVGWLED